MPIIRFSSEKERSQHPEARLIPSSVWSDYELFREEFSDDFIPLMNASDDELLLKIQQYKELFPDRKQKECAWLAIFYSHSSLSVEFLVKLGHELEIDPISLFKMGAVCGHLTLLEYLVAKAPESLQAMIEAHDYEAFHMAAENGHLDVLRYLVAKAPGRLQEMIEAFCYQAFRYAAENGHLDVLHYLEEKAPASLQAMIEANDYAAFRIAAKNRHLPVMRYLGEKAPASLLAMIEADDYAAFQSAARNGDLDVMRYLLNHPGCFVYAEQHQREYGEKVISFLSEKIASLRAQKTQQESDNPTLVFNIENPTQAKLLFYMTRHLIRLNVPAHRDDLLFLLSIPSVRGLAATYSATTHIQYSKEQLRDATVEIDHTASNALRLANKPAGNTLASTVFNSYLSMFENYLNKIKGNLASANNYAKDITYLKDHYTRLQTYISRQNPPVRHQMSTKLEEMWNGINTYFEETGLINTRSTQLNSMVEISVQFLIDWDRKNKLEQLAERIEAGFAHEDEQRKIESENDSLRRSNAQRREEEERLAIDMGEFFTNRAAARAAQPRPVAPAPISPPDRRREGEQLLASLEGDDARNAHGELAEARDQQLVEIIDIDERTANNERIATRNRTIDRLLHQRMGRFSSLFAPPSAGGADAEVPLLPDSHFNRQLGGGAGK